MISNYYLVFGFAMMFLLLRPVPVRSTPVEFMKVLMGEGFEIFWRAAVLAGLCWAIFQMPLSVGNVPILKFVLCFAAAYFLHLFRRKELEFFFCSLAFGFMVTVELPGLIAGQLLFLFLVTLHWLVFYVLLEGVRLRLLTAGPPKPWKGLPVFLISAAFLVTILAAIQTLSDIPR